MAKAKPKDKNIREGKFKATKRRYVRKTNADESAEALKIGRHTMPGGRSATTVLNSRKAQVKNKVSGTLKGMKKYKRKKA